jgi:hypothetical protein
MRFTSLALGMVIATMFHQTTQPQNLGTLRMVISNKDRMHPGVIDGKVIDRPRPVAGMLFSNDEGDEVGGLTYTGRVKDGVRAAITVDATGNPRIELLDENGKVTNRWPAQQ